MPSKEEVIKLAKAHPAQARLVMAKMNKVCVKSLTTAQRVAFVNKMKPRKAKPRTVDGMVAFSQACRRSGMYKTVCACKQCVVARKAVKGTVTV